jgi:O-6-methylguanine DNA methyltransferase
MGNSPPTDILMGANKCFSVRYGHIFLKFSSGSGGIEEVKLVRHGEDKPVSWEDLLKYDLDLSRLTAFERTVFLKVREIPPGKVSTYKEVARAIGNAGASRAVGNALAKNPLPILVPCHRVVRSDLSLGDYSYGERMKKKILEGEGIEFEGRKVRPGFLFTFYRP